MEKHRGKEKERRNDKFGKEGEKAKDIKKREIKNDDKKRGRITQREKE